MKSNLLKLFLIFTFSIAFVIPLITHAQTITIRNPLSYDTFDELVKGIIRFLILIASPVAALLIVIAGYYFVTSAGNPQQITTAKKIILYTLVGYGIILLSYGLITIVRQILGVNPPGP